MTTVNVTEQDLHWQAALAAHWGIDAGLERLDGEYDLNFLARTAAGAGYVLKVMRRGCEAWLVDMQMKAFEHITARAPDLPCPQIVRAKGGEALLEIEDAAG